MADVKWIKLSTKLFDNRKIRQIECLPDGDAIIVIWLKLMCLAGNINDSGMVYFTKEIPYTDQMLATQFNRPLTTVQLALKTFEQFEMIEIIDNILHISNWEKYQNVDRLSELREYNRIAKQKSRAKTKQKLLEAAANVNDMSMTSQCSHDTDIDKDIDIDIENINNVQKPRKSEIDRFFDSLWSLYPVKKGKGQVSETKKKVLYEIGEAEMHRALHRYLTELKKDAWRKPQNGSTFFNSGYVDYLDANFEPQAVQPASVYGANGIEIDESKDDLDAYF